MDDEHLLAEARLFESKSLAEIYDRYSPVVYAYALRLLGDRQLAEDCVSETFTRFLKALRAGGGPREYLRAYLYRVAHNWITDIYRQNPPQEDELDEDWHPAQIESPEEVSVRMKRQERLRHALRLLTAEQRQVVMLRFVEDLPAQEVAAAIAKPTGAVKALQHRALTNLRRMLWKEAEDEA